MRHLILLTAVFCLLILDWTANASGVQVYTNDFQGVIGSEWSSSKTNVTPIASRRFLGQFWNDTVSLNLANLPQHTSVTVSFDLFVIRTWDGNIVEDPGFPGEVIGPDVWDMSVVGGTALIHTTFNNHDFNNWPQAYPGSYPSGDYLARTGAVENNTLGYTWGGYGVIDSVYHPVITFDHFAGNLELAFSSSLVDWNPPIGIDNESWGLDNIVVSVVPEPGSLIALACGVLGLAGIRRRRASVS